MQRLYFLWDYDFNEKQVKTLLKTGDENTRRWLIARILQNAKYEDIWKYITLKELFEIFPYLKLRSQLKPLWEYTLNLWQKHEHRTY